MDTIKNNLQNNIPNVEPNTMAGNVMNVVYGIAGLVAVVMIVYAGVIMTTSNGDAGKVGKAKKMLLYSIIGLVVVILAMVITNFVVDAL